jgi:hypothetical protein
VYLKGMKLKGSVRKERKRLGIKIGQTERMTVGRRMRKGGRNIRVVLRLRKERQCFERKEVFLKDDSAGK